MTPTETVVDPVEVATTTTMPSEKPVWMPVTIPPVTSPELEQLVTDAMNRAKRFQTTVKDFFKLHKQRAAAVHDGLCKNERDLLAPAQETEEACKRELSAYRVELDRLAALERRRLEDLARKEEEERRVQEAAALELQASATEDLVDAHEIRREAEALIERPIPKPAVYVPAAPRAAGVTYTDKWNAAVTDKVALIVYVAQHVKDRPDLVALLDVNEGNARRLSELRKQEGEICPGLMATKTKVPAGRNR